MTGALKYALLQSFLLATGDDPEEERGGAAAPGSENGLEQPITGEQLTALQELIEETNTDLERVLAYYKLNSLRDMNGRTYRRAFELLNRKRARRGAGGSANGTN